MRITICDVCDEKFDADTVMLQVLVPTEFLNTNGDALVVDVCGWPCMNQMVDNFLSQSVEDDVPDMEEQERERKQWKEENKDEAPKPFVMVPKTPTIDTDMSPADMARYTEAVTGVKRRT